MENCSTLPTRQDLCLNIARRYGVAVGLLVRQQPRQADQPVGTASKRS
jgi:hypothetical protein